jgi:hypothetical protein
MNWFDRILAVGRNGTATMALKSAAASNAGSVKNLMRSSRVSGKASAPDKELCGHRAVDDPALRLHHALHPPSSTAAVAAT